MCRLDGSIGHLNGHNRWEWGNKKSWPREVKCLRQNLFQCPLPLTMMVLKLYRMYLKTATLAYLALTIKLTSDIWKPVTQKAIMLPKSCISMTGFRNASNFFTKLKYINSLCYNLINIRNVKFMHISRMKCMNTLCLQFEKTFLSTEWWTQHSSLEELQGRENSLFT